MAAGQLRLAYLDEVGFSPSLPVTWTWYLPGRRKLIPYENPQNRRVNTLAALICDPEETSLWWGSAPRSLTSDDLLVVLRALPHGDLPLVVVLDNASIHTSAVIQEARAALEEEGIYLFYLPPYSSAKLNLIEPHFGALKYYDLPERTYATLRDLFFAVEDAFARADARLLAQSHAETRQHLRPTA